MNEDSGNAKGGFWDRIRVRFLKIIKKFRFLRKRNKDYYTEKYDKELIKRKKEEELYNYYRNRVNNTKKKGIFSSHKKTNEQLKNENKKQQELNVNINKKKKNEIEEIKIKKDIKLNNNIKQNLNLYPFQTILSKNNMSYDNQILNNNNVNQLKKDNINISQTPKQNKNVVKVNQNVEAFNRIGKSGKFSLKRKNKFKNIKKTNQPNNKKVGIVAPIINKIVPKKDMTKPTTKEKKELKKSFSIKEIDLTKFNEVNNELDKKLLKQKEISDRLTKLVNEIKPEKRVDVQYHFINNLFSNLKNLFLSVISIPLLKRPKNIPLFSVGLFMFNNSLRNMRKMITRDETISFIPSDTYVDAIKENINNFELIDYMIDDSLLQISSLKSEYSNEFSEYSDSRQFREIIEKLNSYEQSLKEKQKRMLKEKEQMNLTLDKNCKKLQLIKDMNS